MKRLLKMNSTVFILSFLSLIIIIFDVVGDSTANLFLLLHPVLHLILSNAPSLVIVEELQLKETSSMYIHFNYFAYVISFLSFVLVGFLIDLIKNKIFFCKHEKA